MAAVEKAVVLLVLERRGEIEEVEGVRKTFDGIVKVGRRLGVFTDYQVIKLTGTIVLEDCGYQEGGGAAPEVFAGDPLRVGQQDLVRQLKKVGGMRK
jgi:hypothetical protein